MGVWLLCPAPLWAGLVLGNPHMCTMAVTVSTAPFHGYQVLFSPYSPHKLAFSGAQNYGIAGEYCSILATLAILNLSHEWYFLLFKSSRLWCADYLRGRPHGD